MSSSFFRLALSISSALVDCLPSEYDSLVDKIEMTNVENSHNLQRFERDNRGNESNTNHINSGEFQQIRDIRITATPEWLRRVKNEFCENQNKRDAMGLHVLAIARTQECNRALRFLHSRQFWNNNNNITDSDNSIISSSKGTTNTRETIYMRNTRVKTKGSNNYRGDYIKRSRTNSITTIKETGQCANLITPRKTTNVKRGRSRPMTQPKNNIGSKTSNRVLIISSNSLGKKNNPVQQRNVNIMNGKRLSSESSIGNSDKILSPSEVDDENERSLEETYTNSSLYELLDQSKDFYGVDNSMQTTSSNVIQLEYETECEEEEVLLTSQQEYFNEMRENIISHQVAKNDVQQQRTCICDSYYDSFNDNYLNFVMGSNTSSSISIREELNDFCEEEEWEVMLIGQTIACSLKVNESKENETQQKLQIMSNNNAQGKDPSNVTLDISFDNEQQSIFDHSSLNFSLQEMTTFVNNPLIDQYYGQTDLSTNVNSPASYTLPSISNTSPLAMSNDFPMGYFNYGMSSAHISPASIFGDEDEIPLDLMFTNIEGFW